MQQFEKKYLDKQGYLNLRKLCPYNVNYLIEKTNNSELNIMRVDSKDVKSVDLIKWSDLSSKEKVEVAKILLKNQRQFYEKKASKWRTPSNSDGISNSSDAALGLICILIVWTPFWITLISPTIFTLTAMMSPIVAALVGTPLIVLTLIAPVILFTLGVFAAYLGYELVCKIAQFFCEAELARINTLEQKLSSLSVNAKNQEVKIEPNAAHVEHVKKVTLIGTPRKNIFFNPLTMFLQMSMKIPFLHKHLPNNRNRSLIIMLR